MKPISEYKALVFDLDGTLYYQDRLRIKMAWMLLSYYLCHFWRIKELFIIKDFRKIREHWDEISPSLKARDEGPGVSGGKDPGEDKASAGLEDAQYAYVAGKFSCPVETVRNTIETWMYSKPLKAVFETRDSMLLKMIGDYKEKGQKIFIFSDYPIEDKLAALGLKADGMYAATDERLNELKPSPKGLKLIMQDHGLEPGDLLMIGDRMSRDGQAALNAGCDYLILPKNKAKREKLYKKM
ncbi:MAG: HAD family hydrolase [Lachnospiraceae bacterium]|nr:HAD family hydrolase [Lachnospiraceae bacterium]